MGGGLMMLDARQRKLVAAVFLCGAGAAGASALQDALRIARKEQTKLVAELEAGGSRPSMRRMKSHRIAVNRVFLDRLWGILKICVPSVFSPEAGLVAVQGVLLVSRTLLTDYISRIEARAGRMLIQQEFPAFGRRLALFTAVALPAAAINSGLKCFQRLLKLAFMGRLTRHLHSLYCNNRAYYAASTLGGLQQADQRITEDVERFAHAISELYGYTLKPLLDVALFTRSLSRIMGYRTQLLLYGYYVATAGLLRATSPPLALMTAQETALSGALRSAHQRLVAHNEEVAFNDPPGGKAERLILNNHLTRLLRHSRLSALQQFVQQVFDGYLIKYFATTVALLTYAAPIYLRDPASKQLSQGELTQDYIRAMRLLQNTSRGIGDLVMVYKRVTALAGHTSRVAELLEQVKGLSVQDDNGELMRNLYLKNVSSTGGAASSGMLAEMDEDGELPDAKREEGDHISFDNVLLLAPGGGMLVRGLSFEVQAGRSVLVMGPNGCGKSSLFRVMAGLWPLQAGTITLPPASDLFYLSQRPYLVSGSLRDQLLYPLPPLQLWRGADPQGDPVFKAWMRPEYMDPDALEERLGNCLEAVELDYLLRRSGGWNQVTDWSDTLSGGEKQRLAMARLLFHHPRFAVLDECTSAVSADGELTLYRACLSAGITLFSIAHRPALRAFHSAIVHFDGCGGWRVEETDANPELEIAPSLTNAALQQSVASMIDSGSGGSLSSSA